MRIFITHCSGKKDNSLKNTGKKATPEKLYLAAPLQRFVNRCKDKKVSWAILSDLHGIWFPDVEHEWYDKPPNTVTEQEFKNLVNDFNQKLHNLDEIWFYYNPGRFHPVYKRLVEETKFKNKIKMFTHIKEIV